MASTSTKNPEYRDVLYVEELIARDTVNTMPLETIEAFADHGEVRGQTATEGMDRAHRLWADLAELGIDEDDVGHRLEREGSRSSPTATTAPSTPSRPRPRSWSRHDGQPLAAGERVRAIPPPTAMVVFGGSGDLAHRKIVPALYNLELHRLPQNFAFVGSSRSEYSDEEYRADMRKAVEEFSRTQPIQHQVESFASRLHYIPGSSADSATYDRIGDLLDRFDRELGTDGNRLFYLSLIPKLFPDTIRGIGKSGLGGRGWDRGYSRVVVEKPFGHDLTSARELQELVTTVFPERDVFRIDHYLGKESVQNIIAFRFANGIFEPVWNHHFVDHVQVTVSESLGIEHRGNFYETAGAIRDIFQNHELQVLALVAMEPPASFEPEDVRNEKAKVLKALRRLEGEAVDAHVVRGQYGPGWIDGKEVPATARSPTSTPTRWSRPTSPPSCGSTTGAGRARRSTCAPASACPSGPPRSWSSSSRPPPALRGGGPGRAGAERAGAADPARRGHHHADRGQGAGPVDGGPLGQHGLLLRHLVLRRPARRLRAAAAGRDAGRPDPVPALGRGRAGLAGRPADPGPVGGGARPRVPQLRGRQLGAQGRRRADRPGPPRPPLAAAMSQSNQTAEAFEEVAPGDIEQALERQRVQGENGGGSVVRASVANLVVVTPTRAAGQRALAAVEELGSRAPSRCVVLIAEPPEGRQGCAPGPGW